MERRLAAILAADVVGYTRLMGAEEAGTLRRLTELRQEILEPLIAEHRGRIVKLMGDGVLVEFASVVDAVACALAWQQRVAQHEADGAADTRLQFRIGINLGDVIAEGGDIHGDGVNLATRLEGLAEPGSICLSAKVHEEVKNRLDLNYEDLGLKKVKNVAEPVHAFRVVSALASASGTPSLIGKLALPDRPSIAVLPFENMSGDPEQDYFADGVAEDILTELSRLPDLFVIDRHSSFAYKGKAVGCRQVGAELGVRYVLEGAVRRSGNRARITAQLIDATSGNHVWAERYDRDLADIFAVQDDITRSIVMEVAGETAYGEYARRYQRDTENFEAWDCMLQVWRQFLHFSMDGFNESIRLSEKALALDPNFGSAYAALAWSYFSLAKFYSDDPAPLFDKAMEYAGKTLAFDSSRDKGLTLITQKKLLEHRHDEAIALAKEALSLSPNSADNHFFLGYALLYAGQGRKAIAQTEQAMRISPFYPAYFVFNLVDGYRIEGHLDRALEWVEVTVERMPESYLPLLRKAGILSLMGRDEEAREAGRKAVALYPGVSLKNYAASQPYKFSAHLEPYIEALRKAGLPE